MVNRGLQWQSVTEMMECYLDHRLHQVVIKRESTQHASSVNIGIISRHEVSGILRIYISEAFMSENLAKQNAENTGFCLTVIM